MNDQIEAAKRKLEHARTMVRAANDARYDAEKEMIDAYMSHFDLQLGSKVMLLNHKRTWNSPPTDVIGRINMTSTPQGISIVPDRKDGTRGSSVFQVRTNFDCHGETWRVLTQDEKDQTK